MTMRNTVLAVVGLLLGACTTPTAGNAPAEAGPAQDPAKAALAKKVWHESKVSAGVGEAHNMLPQETSMVKAAVDAKRTELRKCFEEPVLQRGCRTAGIPASFDAMLMIATDGSVRDTRIVPNKNDLAKECYDAVRCVQDVFATVTVQGLTRFEGTRQVYMTVTLLTPDESTLVAADGG
jgi:hypothetical protein